MTSPLTNDRLSTPPDVRERKIGAKPSDAGQEETSQAKESATTILADSADISRASERLLQDSQEIGTSNIADITAARERLAQLQLSVATDPASVVKAFRSVNSDSFLAAMAEPSS